MFPDLTPRCDPEVDPEGFMSGGGAGWVARRPPALGPLGCGLPDRARGVGDRSPLWYRCHPLCLPSALR